MITTENKIKLEFKRWATAHGQINSFFWGEPFRSWKENVLDFAVMIGYFTNGNFDNNQTGIQINLIFADKKYKDESNVDEIWSDTLQMARDAYQMLNKSTKWRQWGKVVGSPSYTKFNNDTGDVLAGHAVQINFALRDQSGICDIPTFGYDYENQTQPSIECLPVTLFNSNLTWEQVVASGEPFEVPDTPVTVKNQSGATLGTASLPSVTGGDVVVNTTCQPGTVTIKNTLDEILDTVEVASGGTSESEISDSKVTVNGDLFKNIPAANDFYIEVVDQNDDIILASLSDPKIIVNIPTFTNPIVRINGTIVGNPASGDTLNLPVRYANGGTTVGTWNTGISTWEIPPNVIRSTAKLLKTGQTWSIATGDDGNLQSGRLVDWYTLQEVPLHNNGVPTINTTTNRFTDTLGSQTYANGIVLDWSTWDGSSLLGTTINITTHPVTSMTACITYCNSFSLGGFSSGWKLWNRTEANNFINLDWLIMFESAPWNNTSAFTYWTSSTKKNLTTQGYRVSSNVGSIDQAVRTGNAKAMPVRYFNLSLTNILT